MSIEPAPNNTPATKKRTQSSYDANALIANRVRAVRLAAGWSQTKLGAALGVTFQQVQKYEKGISYLTCARLLQIAEVLKVSPVFLLLGKEGQPPPDDQTDLSCLVGDRPTVRTAQALSAVSRKTRIAVANLMVELVP